MEEIVLVGNGRSLLARPGLGETLDDFGLVARFNNFHTVGFESFVGGRTDWWIRNESSEVLPRREPFSRIVVRPRLETAECYRRTLDEVRDELRRTHPGTLVEALGRDLFLELCAAYGHRGTPLTGTLAVAHLLRTRPRVHVCGFDGLSGGEEALRHYYSEGNVVGDWDVYHEHDLDALYLRDRIEEGRVVVL